MNTITILIDYVQHLSIITSVNVPWPAGVDVAIGYVGFKLFYTRIYSEKLAFIASDDTLDSIT